VREGFTKQADISGELNKLRADLLSVNTQLEIYKGVNVSSNAATNNNAEYIGLINRNRELAGEMARKPGGFDADLNEQILANQRKMQQLAATAKPPSTEAAETRRKREELTNRKIALENQIIAQEQTLASIGITIKTYENKGRQGAGADIKVAAMQAQIDMANKQYEVMLTRLQGAQDVNLAPDINFKQTLLGQPAIKPESANRKASILLSTLSALLLSSLSIIILDFTDKSLRAPSIFTRSVNIKLLTTLPQISLTNTIVSSFFSKNTEDGRSDNATKLADSMRKLRYEIEASGKRIILVTSTKTKEGKSTIIEALANSFGQTKKRVLLVDANFSNNSLTQRYDAKATLEKISAKDERDFGAQLVDASSKTDIINCNIIGCDSADYSPAEILPKNSLLEYLPVVLTAYDFVLIEAANLNEHADAKELARYADGIVVVFSARSVIKPQDEESIQFLQTQKDKLIGAVLNNIDKENLAL
jgi:Mrp family chromosome partitioning ATPase